MLTELAIGVIVFDGISHWLLFTPTKVYGRKGFAWLGPVVAQYLGAGSKASQKERENAQKAIEKFETTKFNLIELHEKNREFVIPKESIVRIDIKIPHWFSGGRVVFKTLSEEFEVKTTYWGAKYDQELIGIMPALLDSLKAFAPDRFYDEESGRLVNDMVREGWRYHYQNGWKLEKPPSAPTA